ncbi:nucleoside phosphorylase [Mammaliicoccus sciuri]|uniref:nucleoside phosphorylase n=1 Tax=Mammaliicoccus sciuri TaxID=1296 RepID=UPI0022A7C5B6|nr:nucleoside phosphorylase [Mammaliicoccus sciuri]
MNASNGAFPIYQFIYKGKAVAFYLSAIGSMLASQYCMICNWVTGATKFVMFGSAGSLDNERTFNKFIIPTHSYRDEGMSYHYAPPSDYIKVKNANKVTEVFNKLALPFIEGKVWTTDAVLRETNLQYNKRKKEGCIAVDMELAGVQAVCDFHGFELFSFLVTGDVLSEGTYNVDGLKEANHNINKFHVAMNIIEELNL